MSDEEDEEPYPRKYMLLGASPAGVPRLAM